mgnify:CR=1 FL=1
MEKVLKKGKKIKKKEKRSKKGKSHKKFKNLNKFLNQFLKIKINILKSISYFLTYF